MAPSSKAVNAMLSSCAMNTKSRRPAARGEHAGQFDAVDVLVQIHAEEENPVMDGVQQFQGLMGIGGFPEDAYDVALL